jgi:hypothetical protein
MQPQIPLFAIFASTLLATSFVRAGDVLEGIELEEGHGYVLVHLYGQDERSVKGLRMRNVETGETRTVLTTRRNSRGPETWLEVIAVPAGQYYWSSVQLGFRNSPTYNFDEPSAANYVFNVVPGVVTYIGDWLIDGEWINNEPRMPTTHNQKTLADFAKKFPRHAAQFEIYFSVEGREPFSISDLPRFTSSGEE